MSRFGCLKRSGTWCSRAPIISSSPTTCHRTARLKSWLSWRGTCRSPRWTTKSPAATRPGRSAGLPMPACRRGQGASGGGADIYPAPAIDHLPTLDVPDATDPFVEIVRCRTEPSTNKVAFRDSLLAAVHQGNHWVNVPAEARWGCLEIRHFPVPQCRAPSAQDRDAHEIIRTYARYFHGFARRPVATLGRVNAETPGDREWPTVVEPVPLGRGAVGNITCSTASATSGVLSRG